MTDLDRELSNHVADLAPTSLPGYDDVIRRRDSRRRGRRVIATAGLCAASVGVAYAVVAITGPGPAPREITAVDVPSTPPEPQPTEPTPTVPPVKEWDGKGFAPPISLWIDGELIDSRIWTACYDNNGCYDGAPGLDGKPLTDAGDIDVVEFSFPDPGWTFQATFRAGDETCSAIYRGTVETTGSNTFRVAPSGPAGAYSVELFGRGPEGGDVITTIMWTTPVSGPGKKQPLPGRC